MLQFEDLPNYAWHAVWCRPQREMDTAHRLFHDFDVPYIVPAEKRWEERRGRHTRKKLRTIPVFPRCVFAGFDMTPDWDRMRKWIPTLQGYLTFGRGPERFKLPDMEWLLAMEKRLLGEDEPKPFNQTVKSGDRVRFVRGPFTGLELTVDAADAKKVHRFRETLGAMRIVDISLADLEPIV